MPYTWVHSAGGPLLIAPESELGHWAGVEDAEDMDGAVETWGDYGRACSVRNYIGLVAVGSQQALVLGDQPARTTYLPGERVFLRGAAAGSDEELVDVVRRVLRDITWDPDEDLVWEVREPVMLFDSAWAGAEIEPDNRLLVDLDPGSYRVRATSLRDSGDWMILVQLQQG
ncbi:Imm21 family immunity protein [Nocardia sp. NBC_01329]|uniref:Imm21 family immunity protein n=1 Tax=Nocardia sp. NBC_01329 TaxID=2903594 RepID=UPI002E101BED|nr:immunity 21 family protein [Nocardia sp. NBC_01329]